MIIKQDPGKATAAVDGSSGSCYDDGSNDNVSNDILGNVDNRTTVESHASDSNVNGNSGDDGNADDSNGNTTSIPLLRLRHCCSDQQGTNFKLCYMFIILYGIVYGYVLYRIRNNKTVLH